MAITLCHIDEIPESGAKGFDLPRTKLFGVKKRGQLYLYLNRCPHAGIPLEWIKDEFLDEEGHYIHCSNHGAVFLPDTGECIQGPCMGDTLWSVDYRVENGQIIIPEEELPEFPGPA